MLNNNTCCTCELSSSLPTTEEIKKTIMDAPPKSLLRSPLASQFIAIITARHVIVFITARPVVVFITARQVVVFITARPVVVFITARPVVVFITARHVVVFIKNASRGCHPSRCDHHIAAVVPFWPFDGAIITAGVTGWHTLCMVVDMKQKQWGQYLCVTGCSRWFYVNILLEIDSTRIYVW